MSAITKQELEAQRAEEVKDSQRVCAALKTVMDELDVSAAELAERTGIAPSNVQRMARMQEPKPSEIVRLEKALDVRIGTILRRAGMIDIDEHRVYEMLETDPKLHPVLRSKMVTDYRSAIKLSKELDNR